MLTLRKATIKDLEGITEIYNEAILNTTATFDTQPETLQEQKKWFDNQAQAVRWFIDQYDNHMINLRKHGFDCQLPTMCELIFTSKEATKEDKKQ